ncbi:MAG: T9SS type A sorting domain-containing protein [Bacteroidota bacterium]
MKRNNLLGLLSGLLMPLFMQAGQGEGGQPLSFKFAENTSRVPVETMQPFNVDSMLTVAHQQDAVKGPYKFGYNHFVNINLRNSGVWQNLPDGTRFWRVAIKCPGAVSVNLAFNNFHIPEGGKLFVYSTDRQQILGAFTSTSNFADQLFGTELITGEEVMVEYIEPAAVAGQGTMNIYRITHGFRGVSEYVNNVSRGFGDSGACNNNANCPGGASWSDQKRSVVCLVSGGSEFCTGALVNNTCQDGTPYVLTADHCGSADGSWVFRFNWESSGCSNPTSNPTSQSLSGGTARASNPGSDVHLCQINTTPPANYNVYYSGWSNLNVPADSACCIHHPAGDIKKITWARNPTISSTYGSADCWRTTQWTSGVTEPGSSGSPLFDQNHRIVGQLFGGPSACNVPASSLNDYYGKFSYSWNTGTTPATRLRDWLDPCNTNPTTLDGYDPNTPTAALDAQMAAVVSPAGAYNSCSATQTENVVVTLRNAGLNTLTSCTINWQVDTNAPTAFNWTGSLTTSQTALVTLGTLTLPTGTHTITVTVSNPNNGTDGNAANNTSASTFTFTVIGTAALPVAENFQNTPFPALDWQIDNPGNGITWTRSTTVGNGSTASMFMDNFNTDTRGTQDSYITPVLNFASVTAPATLTFDVAYARYSATYSDTLGAYISTDCGVTWTQVFLKSGTTLSTAPDNTNAFTPNNSQWRTETVNLNSYIGQASVRIALRCMGGYGNFLYVDNINVTVGTLGINELSTTAPAVYPNPSAGGLFTVDFSNTAAGNVQWSVMNVAGQIVKMGQQNNPTLMPLDLSALAPGVYFLQVNTQQGVTTQRITITAQQ